jgi:hypothetical protein
LPTATRDDIRVAYRNLARQYHPDAKADASATRMTEINEAWRVLSDPGRRAAYNALLRASAVTHANPSSKSSSANLRAEPLADVASQYVPPARFPWRFLLVVGGLAVAFILVNAAFTKPATPPVPDNLLANGSCVDLDINGDAFEVLCNGQNDGVVVALIPFDSVCGEGTQGHRDRQGLAQVCVALTSSG